MTFTGRKFVEADTGPAASFKDMGDGTEAQAVVPIVGTSPVSTANPVPTTCSAIDESVGKMVSGNVREKWKCGFSTLAAFLDSFTAVTTPASDMVFSDGNVAGASYIDICKSALVADTSSVYLAKKAFRVPYQLETGFGLSQRIGGQEFYLDMVGVSADADGNVQSMISTLTPPSDLDIAASIVIATNVWTVTLTQKARGTLRPGDYISIFGCQDTRLNVSCVVITALVSTSDYGFQFTLSGMSDNTYTGITGGKIRYVCPAGAADYTHGLRMYGTSASNVDTVRRNGATDPTGGNGNRASLFAWNPGNTQTDSVVASEGGVNYAGVSYVRAFKSKGLWRTEHTTGFLQWISKDQDSTTNLRSTNYRESEIPAQDQWYALRLRAINMPNLSRPVGTNLSCGAVTKSGSTTWNINCPGHGLNSNSRVRYYGALDQTNFPNVTADTQVTVVNADNITLVSTTGTASSYGGVLVVSQNGQIPSIQGSVAQTYAKSYDGLRLVLVNNGAQSEVVGNIVTLAGCVTVGPVAQTALQGRYRIARISGTTTEIEPMDGASHIAAVAAAPASATACTGVLIRNTSFRLHYAKVIDYVRMLVEPVNANNNSARSAPTYVTGGSLTANQGTRQTIGAGWYVEPDNTIFADIASAAITSTATSSTITPTPVGGAAVFSVPVTVVSGTTPTLDLAVEESDDTGTNWYRIYEFPRITATGMYRSPMIPLSGNRIRYVRTIAGTTPSFTMAVNRITHMMVTPAKFRQIVDRSVVLTTLNSVTPSLLTGGATKAQLVVNVGAITTTAPQLQIEGSDDNGASWFAIGAPLTAVASSTVRLTVSDVVADRLRARISTAGVAVTAGYVLLRSYGDAT